MTEDTPSVSIIIPTYNSARTLRSCLNSIENQSYPKSRIEVIVVDNYSTDGTREIAAKYGAKILLRGPERSAQMNYGVMNATGEYIFRIDSDMEADRDIIKKCLNLSKWADAIVVPVLPHPSTLSNFWARCRMLEQIMLVDDIVNVAPRFIKRNVFLALGGYDEKLVAWEDYDLYNRLTKLGYKTALLKDSALWHLGEPSSLKDVIFRMYKYGKTGSLKIFTKKHSLRGLKQIFIIRPSFIRHGYYLLTDPVHYLGLVFMKIVQATAYVIGILSQYI